jgi:3-deoxy-7-phosphoheptulonate synthase
MEFAYEMIVIMDREATEREIARVMGRIGEMGLGGHLSQGVERTVIGVVGQITSEVMEHLEVLPGVKEVVRISKPYKLSSRDFHPQDTVVHVGDLAIGEDQLVVMAGPCAVESEEQLLSTAHAVKEAGATVLRGGAFKPRTSPYSFRGMGEEGLKLLARAREETGLPVITEVMAPEDVDLVASYADILQVGARNMQNFSLLDRVGQAGKPVMLKRGMSATLEDWLLAAEYILAPGNRQVILCERGIRTFETYSRNTFDVNAIPSIRRESHLPIFGDPSHGTGRWRLVEPVALAAVAAGAQGLIIEVHPHPDTAKSDGPQSLTFENFRILMDRVRAVAHAVGKSVASPVAAGA